MNNRLCMKPATTKGYALKRALLTLLLCIPLVCLITGWLGGCGQESGNSPSWNGAVDPANLADDAEMELVEIPPGKFVMGSPQSEPERFEDEGPQYSVTIPRALLMGKYEVTQEHYEKVMGTNPSFFRESSQLPVESVTWYDSIRFCNKLSERAGLPIVYTIDESGVTIDLTSPGFRLPTEAEWEYACRAGSDTAYYWGSSLDGNYMWYEANSNGTTHVVGTKCPNGFGLHDMSGNVWEWCSNWHTDSYDPALISAAEGPVNPGFLNRAARGGCWISSARSNRCANRGESGLHISSYTTGFRVVRNKE